MPYSVISVSLTDGQVKKLRSKSAQQCGTTITLKPAQMSGGTHKLSLTDRQIKHFNDALKNHRGVQIEFSKAAIANIIKSGGIFPLFAAIPAAVAAAAPAVAKAAALGAVGALGSKAVEGIVSSYEPKRGRGYNKSGGRLPSLSVLEVAEIIKKIPNLLPGINTAFNKAIIKAAVEQGFKKEGEGIDLINMVRNVGRFLGRRKRRTGQGYKKKGKGLRLPGTPYNRYSGSGLRIPGTAY